MKSVFRCLRSSLEFGGIRPEEMDITQSSVTAFSLLQSMHILVVPSFSFSSTKGEAQALRDSRTKPAWMRSLIMRSLWASDSCLGCCTMCFPSFVGTACVWMWQHPMSVGLLAKDDRWSVRKLCTIALSMWVRSTATLKETPFNLNVSWAKWGWGGTEVLAAMSWTVQHCGTLSISEPGKHASSVFRNSSATITIALAGTNTGSNKELTNRGKSRIVGQTSVLCPAHMAPWKVWCPVTWLDASFPRFPPPLPCKPNPLRRPLSSVLGRCSCPSQQWLRRSWESRFLAELGTWSVSRCSTTLNKFWNTWPSTDVYSFIWPTTIKDRQVWARGWRCHSLETSRKLSPNTPSVEVHPV